jgi:predicted cupin superfamily sugar epimerase
MTPARLWIERLQLRRHPEGGYFRETYRAQEAVARAHLPARFTGDRALSTAIYFLLEADDFSALHTLKQDEGWHFYEGSSLLIHVIDAGGRHSEVRLGRDISRGEEPQAVVRAGWVFGAVVAEPNTYALVGCTAAPGFDFADFAMPSREELCRRHPQHAALIERLTRA